jgi:hypothetical protein
MNGKEKKCTQRIGMKTCRKGATWNHPNLNWRIILKWILKTWDEREWIGFIWFKTGTCGGLL